MRTLGYNCKAKASSAINRETRYISKRFGFSIPELKTSVEPNTRLILTDHTDYAQCVDGAREAIIQSIFGSSLSEGVTYTSENLSRKQIVPKITELLL